MCVGKQKGRSVYIFLPLAVLLAASILLLFLFFGKENSTINALLKEGKKNGLQPVAEEQFSQNGAIQIVVQMMELIPMGSDSSFPKINLSYTVKNNSDRKLLVVDPECWMECSFNGKDWYPLSKWLYKTISNDSSMVYVLGSLAGPGLGSGETDYLYALPGESTRQSWTRFNDAYLEKPSALKRIPDGYYRIIIRFCEYEDAEDLYFSRVKQLTDFGYYCVPFQIKSGEIIECCPT